MRLHSNRPSSTVKHSFNLDSVPCRENIRVHAQWKHITSHRSLCARCCVCTTPTVKSGHSSSRADHNKQLQNSHAKDTTELQRTNSNCSTSALVMNSWQTAISCNKTVKVTAVLVSQHQLPGSNGDPRLSILRGDSQFFSVPPGTSAQQRKRHGVSCHPITTSHALRQTAS
jgi:hypothetical protein